MGSLKRHLTRSAVAFALALQAGTLTAWADADGQAAQGQAAFMAKYRQNARVEAQLLQTAQSLHGSNSQTVQLQQHIAALDKQIQALLDSEQSLSGLVSSSAADSTSNSAAAEARLKQLTATREQLLLQIRDAQKGLRVTVKVSGKDEADDRHPGKGHGKDKQHAKQPAVVHVNLQKLHQLTQQLAEVERQIAELQNSPALKSGHARGDHRGDGEDRPFNHGQQAALRARLEALAKLQANILRLQEELLADLKLWIQLARNGSGAGGWTGQPGAGRTIAGVQTAADGRTVAEGGIVTFTAQLVDKAGRPVKQPGVTVDFAFAPGAADGTLSAESGVTDANGQVTVKATAGSTPGTMELSATVQGSGLRPRYSPVVRVVDASQYATHLAVSGGSFPTSLAAGQTTAGLNLSVLPQTDGGQTVGGDTLRLTSSNPWVLSFAGAGADGAITLAPGRYTLPVLVAKHAGTATVTITDVTEVTHPSLSYTVTVAQTATPTALAVINPDGGRNTSFTITTGGLVGPFTIAVVDANGNVVPANADISLTAAQVNEIIGAGTGIRLLPSGPDVNGVVIPAGQSKVRVWADGVNAGTTHPTSIALASINPVVMSVAVKDAHTIAITYSEPLATAAVPQAADYTVVDGNFTGAPQSVSVSGNVVTLTLPSALTVQHGDTVTVAYNPGSDTGAVQTVWGAKAAAFAAVTATNPL
ncbi:MAG: hypothetical protein IRZ33_04460 [Alicyclobacillaceae bacterium]|nr:hypothetical protein [Alicyclobacillaceae bacterium]